MASDKLPPKPAPKNNDPDIGREVFINCRARAGCKGKLVKITMKFKLATGGNSIRYRCLTCKGAFHITF
jgi:hypothetical protein